MDRLVVLDGYTTPVSFYQPAPSRAGCEARNGSDSA